MTNVSNLITRLQRFSNSIGSRVEDADWYDFIQGAIDDLRAGRVLPWSKIDSQKTFYNSIFKYPLASDFETMLRPHYIIGDNLKEGPLLPYSTESEFYANQIIKLALTNKRGTKYLLSRITGDEDITFDDFSALATEYTVAGDGDNEYKDDLDFVLGSESLVVKLASAVNGFITIERTLDSGIDLTDYQNMGVVTLKSKMPRAGAFTCELIFGIDNTNYYTISSTTNFLGTTPEEGWNDFVMNIRDAVQTGTVDITDIKYFRIKVTTTTGTLNDIFKFNGLYFRIGKNYEFPYITKNNIETTSGSGVYQETIDSGVNEIVWEDLYEDLLLFKALDLAGLFKFKDLDIVQKSSVEYRNLSTSFNRRYPTTEATNQSNYYRKYNKF